jgi:3-keto-disaccharide hydrolase
MNFAPFTRLIGWLFVAASTLFAHAQADWTRTVAFPKSEKPIMLFNGRDLSGWEGQTGKYWSVEGNVIRGANDTEVPASTYLFTKKSFRNFRLLFEVKQTRGEKFSTTHSAVAVLGEKFEDKGDPFGFKGPLLMFCNDWGIWDAHRRNRVYPAGHNGTLQHPSEKIGDWNRIEVLVIGDRIRMVNNGQVVIDFTDQPGMLKASPMALQLHGNSKPQEYRFRGLILAETPEDRLITVTTERR